MPTFANYKMDMIGSVSFSLLTRMFVCQANLPGFVYILLLMFPLQFWNIFRCGYLYLPFEFETKS